MTVPPRRLLAHEVVRYAGEAAAAVVATSRVLAQTEAEAIAVEYEVLPSVVDRLEAIKPGAPVVWPEAPDNVVAAMSYGDAAKVEEAFASAPHKVSPDLVSQRLIPSAMEPRSTIAEIDKKSGRLILHVQLGDVRSAMSRTRLAGYATCAYRRAAAQPAAKTTMLNLRTGIILPDHEALVHYGIECLRMTHTTSNEGSA